VSLYNLFDAKKGHELVATLLRISDVQPLDFLNSSHSSLTLFASSLQRRDCVLLLKVISQHFGQIYSDQIWLSRLATAASSNISEDTDTSCFLKQWYQIRLIFPETKGKFVFLKAKYVYTLKWPVSW
jgi:hypothetical protein